MALRDFYKSSGRERSRERRGRFSLDSQEENAVSQVRAGRGEQGGARATRQVERGKRVSVENSLMPGE